MVDFGADAAWAAYNDPDRATLDYQRAAATMVINERANEIGSRLEGKYK